MRIVRLQAENVKRLKAVEIVPDGDEPLVVVGGRNAQGKSSVLDSIQMALGGKDSIPARPVRDGEEKAKVILELDGMVVERRFTKAGGSTLVVKSAEGASFPSPQAMLDKLVGPLSFDPLEFARLTESAEGRRKQAAILRQALGLDFTKEDQAAKAAYEERAAINRDLKSVEARLDAMPIINAPDKEVSVAALMESLKKAQARNKVIDDIEGERRDAEADVDRFTEQINALSKQMEELKAKLLDLEQQRGTAAEDLERIEKRKTGAKREDTSGIEQQIADADKTNRLVRSKKERAQLAMRARELEIAANAQTSLMGNAEKSKADKLAAAKLPVDGLGITEDGVTLNGIPLEQASSAEQLRLSVAIGLAQNPKLNVLLIRDGSLLDDRSLRMLAEMAAEADAQVWLERVGDGKECSVVIEDGAVKN